VKIKPKIKKIKNSNTYLAHYKDEDGEIYETVGLTIEDAIENWFKNFSKEFGGG
jgi:hypothetical protein